MSNPYWEERIEREHQEKLEKEKEASNADTANLPKGFKEGRCKCGNSYGYCGIDIGYCVKCIDSMEESPCINKASLEVEDGD